MASYLQSSLPCSLSYSHRDSTQSSLLTNRQLPLYRLSASAFQKDRRFSVRRNLQVSHCNSPALPGAPHVRSTAYDFNATAKDDLDYDQPFIASMKDEIMELPPLMSSMAIAGLPPPVRASASYETETEKQLMELAKRWQCDSLKFWIPHTVSMCSFVYGGTVSLERFVALTYMMTVAFVLDDLLFDSPNDSLLEEFGIDCAGPWSRTKIGAFLNHLCVLFQREAPAENLTPIEGCMWECGQKLRRLSNPEWFAAFSDALVEHYEENVAMESGYIEGNRRSLQDVEAYTQMRFHNSGMKWSVLLLELTLNAFLQRKVRAHPTFHQLVDALIINMIFLNDIFSYPKEVVEEPGNPRNVIKVMVESEGMGLPQAAWKTVEMVNANARMVMELEKQLLLVWEEEPWAHDVQTWVEELKAMMSGNLHWHGASSRFRHPESVFPELRDCCTIELLERNTDLMNCT